MELAASDQQRTLAECLIPPHSVDPGTVYVILALKQGGMGSIHVMRAAARNALVVPALWIVMSAAWHFAAVAAQSNRLAALLTNPAFCALLARSVYRARTPAIGLVAAHALGTIVVILLGIVAAFVGAVIYRAHPFMGDVLMQSLSLGYYPPGPDAPFEIGAVLWSVSIAMLVSVGVGMGLTIRKVTSLKAA